MENASQVLLQQIRSDLQKIEEYHKRIEHMRCKIWMLRSEVNCRIEHGVVNGHLDYVKSELDKILA